MGKAASSLGRRAVRPLKDFNLEQRVTKELGKEKRAAAPRHQTTVTLIEESIRDQPKEMKEKLEKRDDLLLERLKSVYVTSKDVTPQQRVSSSNPERPLPTDRTVLPDLDFGYFEPKSVPYGKVTLRDAVEIIKRHQEDPTLWTAQKLALEYKLSVELTQKVLHHFRMFVLVVPADAKARAVANAISQRPLIAPHTIKQLPASALDEDKDKDKKS